jgi:predicted nucleic acid-binding protein
LNYLLDTNVVSELRKGPRCDRRVREWYEPLDEDQLYLSVLAAAEIRQGIERLRLKDPAQARNLDDWLSRVIAGFGNRLLGVSAGVADAWGRMNATRKVPVIDGLMAATANVHGLVLATRNVGDVDEVVDRFENPFA